MIDLVKPLSDKIEVSIFGPGCGESVVIHLGNDEWAIIDSCTDVKSKTPVAIDYLSKISVDYKNQVKFIVITHWHTDHINGISEIVRLCTSAKVFFSSAYTKSDFLTFLSALNNDLILKKNNKTKELYETIKITKEQNRGIPAYADRLLINEPSQELTVYSLSPSDAEGIAFVQLISQNMPNIKTNRKKITDRHENHIGVVLWIKIRNICILLGADMEVINSQTGWDSILSRSQVLNYDYKASIYKVAHHGAPNGDHPDIWTKILLPNCNALIAPYGKGKKKRPAKEDLDRIRGKTDSIYLTADPEKPRKVKRSASVKRVIEKSKFRDLQSKGYHSGHIIANACLTKNQNTPESWGFRVLHSAEKI